MNARDPNSGHHAGAAGTLPTEPSLAVCLLGLDSCGSHLLWTFVKSLDFGVKYNCQRHVKTLQEVEILKINWPHFH